MTFCPRRATLGQRKRIKKIIDIIKYDRYHIVSMFLLISIANKLPKHWKHIEISWNMMKYYDILKIFELFPKNIKNYFWTPYPKYHLKAYNAIQKIIFAFFHIFIFSYFPFFRFFNIFYIFIFLYFLLFSLFGVGGMWR